jgi:NRPS condensation-like uncharacterized protein
MLEKREIPVSKAKKLDMLTKHLPPEKAELFLLLLARSSQSSPDTEHIIVRQPREAGINSFPLSFNQEEFWLLNKLQPECLALNLSSAYVMNGPLNVDALEKAFHEIMKRHENLRTTFRDEDGTPKQYILQAAPFKLPVIDLQHVEKENQLTEVNKMLSEQTFRAYDFANGPLIKMLLIKLGEEEHVVWWGMHHILADGLGLTILVKELKALYSWFAFHKEHHLPELNIQCADYAVWQREYFAKIGMDAKVEYWKKQLSGYNPRLSFPTDYTRPANQTFNGAEEPFFIGKSMDAKLKGLSGEAGISLFMVLFSAFYLLTYYYTRKLDIVIGSPVSQRSLSQRNREDLEHMISDFSNMLLYRTRLSEQDRLYDVMEKVRQTALGAYQNQEVPSQVLFHALKPDLDPAYSPLFQMMFVFHQIFPQEQEQFLEGLNTRYLNVERKSSQFDLSLFMFDHEQEGLYGKFEYNTDLYARESVLQFIRDFKIVINIMVDTPDLKVSEFSSRISGS